MTPDNPEQEQSGAQEVSRHTTALVRQLRSDDYRERLQAVRSLGDTGDVSVIAHLGRMLDDTSAQVRVAAAEALGEIGDAAAAAWLLGALPDRESRVREAVTRGLGGTWDRATPGPLLEAFRRKPRRAFPIVRALARQRITEPLEWLLDANTAPIRNRGVVGLALADHYHGTDALLGSMAARAPSVRITAATALGDVGGIAAVSPLRALLGDDDTWVRNSAASALGRVGAPAGIALAELQERGKRDRAFWVRWACRRAARQIQEALRNAPAEPEAASAPEGTGVELESALAPEGTGTELISEDAFDDEEPEPRERPWWMFWRR